MVKLFILALVVAVAVPFTSCTSRRTKEKTGDLIPENRLVPLLTDVYLTDGLIALPSIEEKHWYRDSVEIYIEVIESHGFTKSQLDQTIRYYFLNKPKKLQKIYDAVIANLSAIESKVNNTEEAPVASENLWPGQPSYALPEYAVADKISFDVYIMDTGTYTLTASFRVFPDDQSENPRITLWFWKSDTSTVGVSSFWEEIPLSKDGITTIHSVSANVPDPSFTRIRGFLLNHDTKPGQWEKHAQVGTISLTKTVK
jgi:hypothetical protein